MSRPASKPVSETGRKTSRASSTANALAKASKASTPTKHPPKFIVTGPGSGTGGGGGTPSTTTNRSSHSSRASTKASKTSTVKSAKKREQQKSDIQLLSPEEIRQLRAVFALYDKDGEGMVSTRDLKAILRAIGYSPSEGELQDMIHEQDSIGDGYLSFLDFAHLMVKRKMSENTENELLEAFHMFDRDKNGCISAEDLRKVMSKSGDVMTEEEIEDMIAEADVNGDGEIDYNEFLQMMLFQ